MLAETGGRAMKIDIKQREPADSEPAEAPSEVKAEDPMQEVTKVQRALDRALLLSDHEQLRRLLSDDCRILGPKGWALDREAWVKAYESNQDQQVRVDSDDEVVQVFGDAAVVTAVKSTVCRFKEAVLEGQFRVTEAWVKDGANWKLAAMQYTTLAA
jgi:hypothetical protein